MTKYLKKCVCCKEYYTTYYEKSKYCSNKCKYKDIGIKERKCPVCNNTFKPITRNQIHCNIKCYSKSEKLKEEARNSLLIKTNKTRIYTGPRNTKPNSGSFKKGEYRISGKNQHSWKGGVTSLYEKIRKCDKSKEWKIAVFSRDGWECKVCRNKNKRFNAHHIKYFSQILEENNIKTIDDANKCKELWDINNGVTLCIDCHISVHKKIK